MLSLSEWVSYLDALCLSLANLMCYVKMKWNSTTVYTCSVLELHVWIHCLSVLTDKDMLTLDWKDLTKNLITLINIIIIMLQKSVLDSAKNASENDNGTTKFTGDGYTRYVNLIYIEVKNGRQMIFGLL